MNEKYQPMVEDLKLIEEPLTCKYGDDVFPWIVRLAQYVKNGDISEDTLERIVENVNREGEE